MAGLGRRLESLEDRRKWRDRQPGREAFSNLSDAELVALERAALSLSPGEPLPPNPFIEQFKRWEAEVIEQQKGAT